MPQQTNIHPLVSIILPARNEEANIAGAIESLAAQTLPVEIVAVNDASTDRTGKILAELAGRYPQLRVIESRNLPSGWVGKNHAVHLGVQEARGDWLLFTDADVRHAPHALTFALGLASRRQADLVSFSPQQELGTWWEKAVMPYVFCRLAEEYPYEEINNPNTPKAAANGQWLLISRKAYDAVGGHEAIRSEILEDVALARRVKQAGFRIRFEPGKDMARTRMYRTWREMWQGWSKNLYVLFPGGKSLKAAGGVVFFLPFLVLMLFLSGDVLSRFVGAGVVFIAHAYYGAALRRNGFPLRWTVYYWPAMFLFAALMVSSWFKHRVRRTVEWKGRSCDAAVQSRSE